MSNNPINNQTNNRNNAIIKELEELGKNNEKLLTTDNDESPDPLQIDNLDSPKLKETKKKLIQKREKLKKKKKSSFIKILQATNNGSRTRKKSKRCENPKYKKDDSLECFLIELDELLMEGYEITQPKITLKPSQLVTKHTKKIEKTFIINIDMEDKSLRTLEEKINKIIMRCTHKDSEPFTKVIEFIRCYIQKETKGKVLLDEIKELELDNSKTNNVEELLSQQSEEGYDIFKEEELQIVEAYAKSHAVINYLLNVVKMIYQYQKGMGYFAKLDDQYFNKFNDKVSKKKCGKTIKCKSMGQVKEINYLVGLTERAIIYDLFMPDSSFIGELTDTSNNDNAGNNNTGNVPVYEPNESEV